MINKRIFLISIIIVIVVALSIVFLKQQPINNNQTGQDVIIVGDSAILIDNFLQNQEEITEVESALSEEVQSEFQNKILDYQLQQTSTSSDAYLQESVTLVALGKYQQAKNVLDKTREMFPEDYVVIFNQANLAERMKQYNTAAELYVEAIKVEPSNFAGYLALANLFIRYSQDKSPASIVYKQALIDTNENVDVLKEYASYLDKYENNIPESIKYWQKALDKTRSQKSYKAIEAEIASLKEQLDK